MKKKVITDGKLSTENAQSNNSTKESRIGMFLSLKKLTLLIPQVQYL